VDLTEARSESVKKPPPLSSRNSRRPTSSASSRLILLRTPMSVAGKKTSRTKRWIASESRDTLSCFGSTIPPLIRMIMFVSMVANRIVKVCMLNLVHRFRITSSNIPAAASRIDLALLIFCFINSEGGTGVSPNCTKRPYTDRNWPRSVDIRFLNKKSGTIMPVFSFFFFVGLPWVLPGLVLPFAAASCTCVLSLA